MKINKKRGRDWPIFLKKELMLPRTVRSATMPALSVR